MSLTREYFELVKKNALEYGINTIVLLQCGSFFEVYGLLNKATNTISGSQIEEFARICDLNVVEKNVVIDKQTVVIAGFKDIMLDKYIKKIQDTQFTVVVYTQDESVKNTTRSLAGVFSPGTYLSLDSAQLTNNTICIWVQHIESKIGITKGKYVVVGVANVDICTGETNLFQFKETYMNNPTTYDELERFISIYMPSEVIFITNLPASEIDDIISYTNIQSKTIHKIHIPETGSASTNQMTKSAINCEKQIYQKETLMRFYDFPDYDVFIQNFYENIIATQSFCFLLDFIFQHNPYLVRKIKEPVFDNCSDRLILANHSLKQLNIIDDNSYTGKCSSVLKMLNCCLTPMGKRKFTQLILNPTTKCDVLQEEYNITEYMINAKGKYDFVKTKLSELKDLAKWVRLIFLRKISPKTFYQLCKNLQVICEIYDLISSDQTLCDYLKKKVSCFSQIRDFCDTILTFINANLDIELCKEIDQLQNFEVNFILRGVDANLDAKTDIMSESSEKLEAIRAFLSTLISTYEKKTKVGANPDYVKIYETEKNNLSLLSTKRRSVILKTGMPKMETSVVLKYTNNEFAFLYSSENIELHAQSTTNNSISNPQINILCKNITTTKVLLKDIILSVYSEFMKKMEGFQTKIDSIIEFVTYIDVLNAKASLAKKYNYCKPELVFKEKEKSFVVAKNLRHCLIENLQQNELYITNDISLGLGEDGILLYGTNAVGKTSLIRALGISIIMAQAGLYVPCSQFQFKPYKYIFTRILGNDNIFKGLSTFAVEMSELRTILRLSDQNSLVLGDELCSGTESISAVSIFVAGIQKLNQAKSSFIFATHLHEIIHYDEITDLPSVSLKHMSVVYDRVSGALIYDRKLRDGPGNSLYGLEVCKSLNLPDDFLSAANQIRNKYHPETAGSLSLKSSHFNSKKLVGLCEKCGVKPSKEVHHLQHQSEANNDNIIETEGIGKFHKNHPANLLALCESCHDAFHTNSKKQHRKVKTTAGSVIKEI